MEATAALETSERPTAAGHLHDALQGRRAKPDRRGARREPKRAATTDDRSTENPAPDARSADTPSQGGCPEARHVGGRDTAGRGRAVGPAAVSTPRGTYPMTTASPPLPRRARPPCPPSAGGPKAERRREPPPSRHNIRAVRTHAVRRAEWASCATSTSWVRSSLSTSRPI